MIRIWINGWCDQAYTMIQLLHQYSDDICIIGTQKSKNSVLQNVCDEWYDEPFSTNDEDFDYLINCMAFCTGHNIDIIIPKYKRSLISENKGLFDGINVKVMVEDFSIMKIIDNKVNTYDNLKESGTLIPDYAIVKSKNDFEISYSRLRKTHPEVCMKLTKNDGGKSFRVIRDGKDTFDVLTKRTDNSIAYASLIEIFKDCGTFEDIMLMPYFNGHEICVDCLKTNDGIIAIPRVKKSQDLWKTWNNKTIICTCENIINTLHIENPCNIRFIMHNNQPFLLEVNGMMSDGIGITYEATGINIPAIAIGKLLGQEVGWKMSDTECLVTNIHVPTVLTVNK